MGQQPEEHIDGQEGQERNDEVPQADSQDYSCHATSNRQVSLK
jgi:hypothetical protein